MCWFILYIYKRWTRSQGKLVSFILYNDDLSTEWLILFSSSPYSHTIIIQIQKIGSRISGKSQLGYDNDDSGQRCGRSKSGVHQRDVQGERIGKCQNNGKSSKK